MCLRFWNTDKSNSVPGAGVTSKIPVVFSIVTDPIALGLVASMERPGGNVTGITSLDAGQAKRQFELLKEVFPGACATCHHRRSATGETRSKRPADLALSTSVNLPDPRNLIHVIRDGIMPEGPRRRGRKDGQG
jgi:hypothetical protein